MNIGILCYPTHGGSGVVATGIGQAMAERGHQVHIISYATPFRFQPFTPNLQYHEVEVSAYPLFRYPPYDLALANTVLDVVESEKLDIIHAHYAIPHAMSAITARAILRESGGDIRIATTLHGTDVTIVGQERGYKRITRFAVEASDAVTVVSEDLARETRKFINGVDKPLHVIPNFVDTERFTSDCCPEMRSMLADPGERIVMHLSNFRPVKRPTDVVEAFARIASDFKARLIMVGDGPLVRECKSRARDLGICDRVRFLGTVDTPWELLPQADVFVLPSEHESFGLAALEAMACGVPVITSNSGGLPEVVINGETGFLTDVGNVNEIAERIGRLLGDDDLHARLSAAARARSVECFSKDRVLPQWESFYQQLMES